MYEAHPSRFQRNPGESKFTHLGRAFKSYAKRYRSPGAPAGGATERKRDRQRLAERHAFERRAQTIVAQHSKSDRDRNVFPKFEF